LPARSRSVVLPLALWLLLSACGLAQQAGASADPPADEADAGADAQLTFTADGDAAATGTVTLEEGGTITATGSDGTTFELAVPAEAVPGDTEITLTPLRDVDGIEAESAQAVLLEPDGLEFHEPARLTITPAEPIPVENQLMFEAAGDGADPELALVDPHSEAAVILLHHFSVAGIATADEAQRARMLERSAANAEARLNRQVRQRIGEERTRNLLGTGDDEAAGSVPREALEAIADEYRREVLDRRRAAAEESCRGLQEYVFSVIRWEQQWQLAGVTDAEEAASQTRVAEALQYAQARHDDCEEEAIAACQDAEDPQILIDFWLWIEDAVDTARARELCLPQDYRIDHTVTGSAISASWTVRYTGVKCGGPSGEWQIESSGTMTGGGGSANLSGPWTVTIPEGSTEGTFTGVALFDDPDGSSGRTEGRPRGTATFSEDPATLVLTVTSGGGAGYSYGFLDTGVMGPGTLTFQLEVGDFCDEAP
jgi:hypothetical protein